MVSVSSSAFSPQVAPVVAGEEASTGRGFDTSPRVELLGAGLTDHCLDTPAGVLNWTCRGKQSYLTMSDFFFISITDK